MKVQGRSFGLHQGWKFEGYRHSLAAKGVSTSFAAPKGISTKMNRRNFSNFDLTYAPRNFTAEELNALEIQKRMAEEQQENAMFDAQFEAEGMLDDWISSIEHSNRFLVYFNSEEQDPFYFQKSSRGWIMASNGESMGIVPNEFVERFLSDNFRLIDDVEVLE